jgi:biotin synthase
MSVPNRITEIIAKVGDGFLPDEGDLRFLLELPHASAAAGEVMAVARELARDACDNRAEICVQIGLNVSPCPMNCRFCSFAAVNGVFAESSELPVEEIVERAARSEADGANSIYLMATGDYPMARFVEVGQEVRLHLRPETPLVANVGDLTQTTARRIADAGFCAVYHAVRMGEGRDTAIPVEKRLRTFRIAKDAGLQLGTCVEPVGPEHTTDEILEKILIHRAAEPCFSGAMRRIPVPGTGLARHGQISELRLAYLVAVARLAMGRFLIGNCTHEPNVPGACAGANLFWAEVGPNPRDTDIQTERGRGLDVAACRRLFEEAEYAVLEGPSVIHTQPTLAAVAAQARA